MLIEQTTYQKKWIESFEKVNGRKLKLEELKATLESMFFLV
ncbi:ATP synthase delta subunit [Streptococcus mutans N34]|nr:ATP synthase delta subunit [Streptococcus mutans N34]